ncbi:MAG: hypothetical protein ISN29_01210 [Gammaproteobacteria bacterium AqS3]|nr:hypothetical protein [Gammaproteobacteria bacterium AqS3]
MNEAATLAITLILVIDPLGNIPVFVSLLRSIPQERKMRVLIRELLIALLIMVLFMFTGRHLLGAFGLQSESLRIGGGIVLFIIAMRMIFPVRGGIMGRQPQGEPFIVPMAIPMIAGPSTLAMLLLFGTDPSQWVQLGSAVLIAWLLTAVLLLNCVRLEALMGERALTAIERLMGMILITVAVQMLLDGALEYVQKATQVMESAKK